MTQKPPVPETRRATLFPKSLGRSLEPVLKPVYKKHGFAEHRILTEWADIVGAEFAACSVPQKMSGRVKSQPATLHVLVAPARALEFQYSQTVILDRIATYFGYKAIGKLVLLQTPGALFQGKPIVAAATLPAPDSNLQRQVAECDDADLRRVLLALGAQIAHNAEY